MILPKLIIEFERWKWNSEFRIYVSTRGNVKDEHKKNVETFIGPTGYVVARTHKGYKTVHRLSLMTFQPGKEHLTVDHIDSNKRNNNLKNLQWVEKKENIKRANEKLMANVMRNTVFNTMEDAVDVCRTRAEIISSGVDIKTIKKKIKASASCNKKWCGFVWQIKGINC